MWPTPPDHNSTRADFQIAPQIAETVTVTATMPIVDTARASTAASVTNEQIANLPLLGRDFRSLASLTPGISSAFGGRITANGARGIATDYNIDGATSNNDFFGENTGGTRAPFTFSQAAIREFQVVRSQYGPEFGRGIGAQLNAITKSGTNEFHGEAFVFHRADSWAPAGPDSWPTDRRWLTASCRSIRRSRVSPWAVRSSATRRSFLATSTRSARSGPSRSPI